MIASLGKVTLVVGPCFSPPWIFHYSLLAWNVSVEKSDDSLIGAPFYVTTDFSLAAFRIFFWGLLSAFRREISISFWSAGQSFLFSINYSSRVWSSSGSAHFICMWRIQGLISMNIREEYIVSRTNSDQSIVQGPESSKSLKRLVPQEGTAVRTHQMGRWTCNEQTCAKWLVFALNVLYIA